MSYTTSTMPELPEVETIKHELSPQIVGRSFTSVIVFDCKIMSGMWTAELRRQLIGQAVCGIARRGKYLLFNLSGGQSLVMHLRMTGTLLLNPEALDRHVRAVFGFSNGVQLVFKDQRRLGLIRLVEDAEAVVAKLGPEPLDQSFTPRLLAELLKKRHIPIKAALLDQSIIAGIGNMYADEALFAARIHPLRKADALSTREIATLCHAIRHILQKAVAAEGASVNTYVTPQGHLGSAQFHFKVAHKLGEPCPGCGRPITRVSVRGRGSYFCPGCQPLTS